jgi:hypothetical protein
VPGIQSAFRLNQAWRRRYAWNAATNVQADAVHSIAEGIAYGSSDQLLRFRRASLRLQVELSDE